MGLHRIVLPLTAAADGTGTATASTAITGFLYGVDYVKTDYDNGVDITINVLRSTETDLIATFSNVTASARWFPRGDSTTLGASASVNTSSSDNLVPIAGAPSITVAQAGNATSGTFIVWWLD